MKRRLLMILPSIVLFGAARVDAQELAGWRWQLDRPARLVQQDSLPESTWRFEQMAPGWHVTTGPGALLYHPAEQASGRFSLVGDFVVFPQTSESGFGIFLGGANLGTDSVTYLSAQLRRDGAVAVFHHASGRDHVISPWTTHSAIKPHTGSGVVTNRLRVAVQGDSLRVFVNDSAVARVGVGGARTSGPFGFRIGEKVNVHLTILDYIRHLAPAR